MLRLLFFLKHRDTKVQRDFNDNDNDNDNDNLNDNLNDKYKFFVYLCLSVSLC